MRYGGSNPPLCTTFFEVPHISMTTLDLSPAGAGRLLIALAVLALVAAAAHFTMEPGRYRSLTWILLGFFAFRVVLGYLRSR